MGLLQSRNRVSTKGLGNLQVREVDPANDADYINAGILDQEGSEIQDIVDPTIIYDEEGKVQDVLFDNVGSRFVTNLKQVGIDEWNYIRNAITKRHSIRYSGMMNPTTFQFFCFEQGQIIPKTDRKFNADQKLPFEFLGLNKDTDGFTTPDFYVVETQGRIRVDNLQLWLAPRRLDYPGNGSAKVMDVSGFARHGDLNSDYASMWKAGTPEAYIQLDGVNDYANFGDILNDNGVADLLFEIWVKIPASNGTSQILFSKKTAAGAANPGYMLSRDANNKISFKIADGTNEVEVLSNSTVLQNVWKHIAVAIDRNGNAQIYINGVADGVAVSVAALATANNAVNFMIGRIGSTYANIQFADARSHKFTNGVPSTLAAILARHYAAEGSYYGL